MINELINRMEHVPPEIVKRSLKGIMWEGTPDSGTMALTFDDGPDPDITPAVLDALDDENIRGTFFMLGENAAKHPEIASLVVERGHLVGNHSMTHRKLFLIKRTEMEKEIDEAQEVIRDITDVETLWFRPPYGIFDFTCVKVVKKRGLSMVLWSVLSGDYSDTQPNCIIETVKPFIKPGKIAVFHDTAQGGGMALPDIIREIADTARSRNVSLGGIDELSVSTEIKIDRTDDV